MPHIFSAKLFGKPRYVPFEDTYLPVPEQAEACLRQMYMDEWWRLPPSVDRSLHTGVHNLYVPYDVYYRDIGTQTPAERIAKIYRRRNRAAARFGEFWWRSRPKFLAFAGRKLRMELERQLAENSFDLYLNDETSRYVFRFIAMKLIIENPKKYGFFITKRQLYQPVRYTEVKVSGGVADWSDWAQKHGISYSQLRNMNPWIRSPKLVNRERRTYTVKIPVQESLYRSKMTYSVYNQNWIVD